LYKIAPSCFATHCKKERGDKEETNTIPVIFCLGRYKEPPKVATGE
jgi:hypothetical protein